MAKIPTPSERAGKVLRILTLATFVLVAFLAIRVFVPNEEAGDATPRLRAGEHSVTDAISVGAGDPLTVRGYVFSGPGSRELRLCAGRKGGDPPRCAGPFLSLYGVDEGGFEMKTGTDPDEGSFRYSPDDVVVTGPVLGTAMRVQVVLGN